MILFRKGEDAKSLGLRLSGEVLGSTHQRRESLGHHRAEKQGGVL